MNFPQNPDPQYFDKEYRLQPELWREAFLALWRDKGPQDQVNAAFYPFRDGTNLVAALGNDWIMKVFPPFLQHQWESEWRVMRYLDGRLTLPIPRFHGSGEVTGDWTYIIMSRLPGVTLEKVWPRLVDADKADILRDIGSIMARVHSLPVGELASLPPLWEDFFPKQILGARARHQRLGMPAWFLNRVDDFVAESLHLIPKDFVPVVLTGEYTPFNLLVHDRERVHGISGMIDFADAMTGYREYDLLGPLLFSCEGKNHLVQALLEGYGIPSQARDKTLRRRLFILQILHRYSSFHDQVRIPDWNNRVGSLEELEQLIWRL